MTSSPSDAMDHQITTFQGSALSENAYEHTLRVAEQLSQSSLIPPHFQGHPANVVLCLTLARDLNINPTQALSQISVIGGKPCLQATLMISLLKQSGKIRGPLQFEWTGTPGKPDRGCYARAIDAETGEAMQGQTITLAIAQAEGWTRNTKYKTSPDNMLQWRAATFFIRAYYPEVVLGVHSAEEMRDAGFEEGGAPAHQPDDPRERLRRMQQQSSQEPAMRDVSPTAEEPEVVSEPTEEDADSELAKDLLAGIEGMTDDGELTRAVAEANSIDNASARDAVKRKIRDRANFLGLEWDRESECFIQVAEA